MTRRILIVDANEAFATILRQGLEEMPDTRAEIVTSGRKALQSIAAAAYDLVIVDLGLTDVEGDRFVRTLREKNPHLRLVVIPLVGEEMPPELADLDLQGTLSKPFFLPDLPPRIEAFFARAPGSGATTPPEPAVEPEKPPEPAKPAEPEAAKKPARRPPRTLRREQEAVREMSRLAQEVGAEAVLLTEGEDLLAHAGRMSRQDIVALAATISESWRTAARLADILGKKMTRFEQSIGGAEFTLYSLAVEEEILLSVVIAGTVTLGMTRHRSRETAEALRRLI